jgi:hypothetical protein
MGEFRHGGVEFLISARAAYPCYEHLLRLSGWAIIERHALHPIPKGPRPMTATSSSNDSPASTRRDSWLDGPISQNDFIKWVLKTKRPRGIAISYFLSMTTLFVWSYAGSLSGSSVIILFTQLFMTVGWTVFFTHLLILAWANQPPSLPYPTNVGTPSSSLPRQIERPPAGFDWAAIGRRAYDAIMLIATVVGAIAAFYH